MKKVLIMIRSTPITDLNYYEALRTAAGLWDHEVKIIWMGKGILGALKSVDQTLTKKFLTDLPELNIELYLEEASLRKNGFDSVDVIDGVELADTQKVIELLEEAEVSLVY